MQVFLSYTPSEKKFFTTLAKELRAINITPISTDLQQMFGDSIFDNIGRALNNCDYTIVILSKTYVKDEWMQSELFAFLMREKVTKHNFVIPIIYEDCEVPAMLKSRICADFNQVPFDQGFGQLTACLTNIRQVFMVMPFENPRLNSAYKLAILPACKKLGYSVVRIDKMHDSGEIMDQVLKNIAKSSIVIVDLSDERQNCYFEAGYAYALEKEIILIAYKKDKVHFDLQGHRIIKWEHEDELSEDLTLRLEAIQQKAFDRLAQ